MKLKSPKVKIKPTTVRCGRGANGIHEHLLEFLVSDWSVPKRAFIFGGVVYVEHVVTVITDQVTRGDAWHNCTQIPVTKNI